MSEDLTPEQALQVHSMPWLGHLLSMLVFRSEKINKRQMNKGTNE
jgi:hypothetical protein